MSWHTLYVFSPRGVGEQRLLAHVTLRDGEVSIRTYDPGFEDLLARLLNDDFEETLGFPGTFVREQRGTVAALTAAARYLASSVGLTVALQAVVCVQTRSTARIRVADSEAMARAALFALSGRDREKVQQTLEMWRAALRYRAELALRYGCLARLKRQEHAARVGRTEKRLTPGDARVEPGGTSLVFSRASPVGGRAAQEGRRLSDLIRGAMIAEAHNAREMGAARA